MDIASLSMSMAQNNVLQNVGTAVLSKAMESNEQMGANIAAMIDSAAMERSVNPSIGSNIDLRV
ncbi:MAG: YjfB family protein [Lachnospiraceae bacterium]|nr:YjfB family protein [Lachnospiraceae bacterium]